MLNSLEKANFIVTSIFYLKEKAKFFLLSILYRKKKAKKKKKKKEKKKRVMHSITFSLI